MTITRTQLCGIVLSDDVVTDVTGISVENIYTSTSGVAIAKIEGQEIYAPSAMTLNAATSSDLGAVKVGGQFTAPAYALQIDQGYAYVNVPLEDKFCTSAWYDKPSKQIRLSVGTDTLCIDVKDFVKEYAVDDKTIALSTDNKTLYVRDGVFAERNTETLQLSNYTLGGYLDVLTQRFGGKAE